jgi:glutathione S-transferase
MGNRVDLQNASDGDPTGAWLGAPEPPAGLDAARRADIIAATVVWDDCRKQGGSMITVWGRNNSVNVQKVLWALAEVGQDFDRKDVGGAFGGLDTPEYKAMNPNSRIPTLVDGELVIWESNAVVRYVAARYGADLLWPPDPGVRAVADQWMDWVQTTLLANMLPVFWGLIRTPPEERDTKAIAEKAASLADCFGILDRALAGRAYVAGDRFSMGDIPVGAMCWRYSQLPIERPPQPDLEAWHDRLQERPAFRQHVMLPLS